MKEFINWDAVVHPVPDVNLDGRPMEGTTYLEHSAPGVSLDSGLMEGMSRLEPLEQLVLGALLVVRPEETHTPERPALASMSDPDQVNNADVNADVDTVLPENSAPMMNSDLRFLKLEAESCPPIQDALGCRPMEGIIEPLQVELSGPRAGPRQ